MPYGVYHVSHRLYFLPFTRYPQLENAWYRPFTALLVLVTLLNTRYGVMHFLDSTTVYDKRSFNFFELLTHLNHDSFDYLTTLFPVFGLARE